MNFTADDLIVALRNEIEHDAFVHRVLHRARRDNVVFNAGKIHFKVTTVTYMGNIVTKDGMRPDPDKIEAIVNMPKPTDKHGLLQLLGMIKYLSQYIPNESSITAPLQSLLKQDAEWSWKHEHDASMDEIRKTLSRDTVLAFYDVRKSATIQADECKSGLRCGLMQQGRPVAFASHALTICFACTTFHQYTYG